jgi:transposase
MESEKKVEVRQIYSESFKRQVIEEYLRSGATKMEIQRKYGIAYKSGIVTWMKKFGYTEGYGGFSNLTSLKRIEVAKKSNPTTSSENLEARVKLLEKQLEDERLRTELLNRMIDLAEKTYKIPVRKNSNTK